MTLKHISLDNAVYYITTVTYRRMPIFVTPSFVIPLIDSLNYYRYKCDFRLLGYVIMPDHMHLLIWPQGQTSVGEIMRDLKKYTSVRIIRQAEVEAREDWLQAFSEAGAATGRSDRKVWQDDYWDTLVYSPRVMREKLNYIHRNPVRAGLVETPEAYAYSSYRNYVNDDEALMVVDREWVSW